MITFRVCPHDTKEELEKWLKISDKIKQIFNQEVDFKPYKNFYEEEVLISTASFKPDIYYANCDATLVLLQKNYKLIGKFKGHYDKFLLISLNNQKDFQNVAIVDKLSSYCILNKTGLYTKEVILHESFDEIIDSLLNGKADAAVVFKEYYDELDQEIKDKLKIVIIEEIDLGISHYFLVSEEFYEKNSNNIATFIQELDLQEISQDEINKLKEYHELGKIIKNLIIQRILIESLKDIDQLIISAETEEELFQRICKNLVEKNHFKFVWVGKREGDFIKPVCKHGKDDGYVDNLVISVKEDLSEGRGPTGKAYRENRIIINENTLMLEDITPWKNELLKRDIHSSIAIPVEKNGEIYAVINIYSTKPFVFRKEFLTLFEEIKQDISFALNKIEKDKENILLRKAIDNSKMWLLITDSDGTIEYVNQYVIDLTGYTKEEIIGKNPRIFKSGVQDIKFYKELWDTILSGKPFSSLFVNKTKDGRLIYIDQTIYPVELKDGVFKFVSVGKDVTEEKLLLEEIEKYKYYDSLTELPNFISFKIQLSEIIKNKTYKKLGLILIDIHNMSVINASYGLEIGNEILKEVAKNLKKEFPDGHVARIGSDEFAILIPNIENESILIYKIRDALDRDLNTSKGKIHISYNASIVLYSEDDGQTFEELYNNAVITLNTAKKEGENVIKFYESQLNKKLEEYLTAEKIVEKAFEKKLFKFYFQPYFKSEDFSIAGFESLIRIVDEDGTVYPPIKFIDYLENSKYITKFEEWALEEVSQKIKKFNSVNDKKDITISLNLSPKGLLGYSLNLTSDEMSKNLIERLKSLPVEVQNNLVIEITERNVIKDIEKSKKIFKDIKDLNKNIKIAIDDFGTGYSSLTYLRDLAIDILKIDMSFVRNIARSRQDLSLVKFIIGLAKDFGLKTIAKGVETEEQVKFLSLLGADYLQGFYFAKPIPEEEAIKLIMENNRKG
ncbi:MAG: EAL domain-containing protein [Sulfurihydrogenibium sp.]|jgi:diguanylate cyclase (GGDEF)-like protein/PAS domain S-box-containing protein|nr:EAL domain-containing protein [Sulfurihydrogenibium sp.]